MNLHKKEFKWAAIFFAATLAWMFFLLSLGWHSENIESHATYSLIYDILFIAIFTLAFVDKRKSIKPESFPFKKALKFGILLTILVTLISPIVQTVTHKFISPEFFPNIIELAVSNNILTQEEALAKFNLRNYILENLIGTFLFGLALSLVLSAIFKKNKQ